MSHDLDANLLCSCGITKEKHLSKKDLVLKWRLRNLLGKADIDEMVKELAN